MKDLESPEPLESLDRPTLDAATREAIEMEQYEVHKHYWAILDLLAVQQSLASIMGRGGPQPPKQPIRLYQTLGEYAGRLFVIEASRYPHDPLRLPKWFGALASHIEWLVMTKLTELAGDDLKALKYHATKEQMESAIQVALAAHVKAKSSSRIVVARPTPPGLKLTSTADFPRPPQSPLIPQTHVPHRGNAQSETTGEQLNRLRQECRLTVEELADRVKIEPRSVYRHISDRAEPRIMHIGSYERVFSQLLERKVVISRTSVKRQ